MLSTVLRGANFQETRRWGEMFLPKSTALPGCPDFPQTLAEKEGRLCIPTGSWDVTASLRSAAGHSGFHVAPRGRHQPFYMPPGALVSPPHPSFEECLRAFYLKVYFQFIYADNHILSPQLFHTSSFCPFICLQLLLIMLLELLLITCECV